MSTNSKPKPPFDPQALGDQTLMCGAAKLRRVAAMLAWRTALEASADRSAADRRAVSASSSSTSMAQAAALSTFRGILCSWSTLRASAATPRNTRIWKRLWRRYRERGLIVLGVPSKISASRSRAAPPRSSSSAR